MANPTCTTAILTEALGVGQTALNRKQREAAILYMMAAQLAAIGGTDYTAVMTTTLVTDAKTLVGRMTPFERQVAWFNIIRNNAIANGATIPSSSLSALNEATGCCFQAYSDLESIEMLLRCKLGKQATYPQ